MHCIVGKLENLDIVNQSTNLVVNNKCHVAGWWATHMYPGTQHDAPTYFSGLTLNSTAVFLSWSSPTLPYGIIISYTITYSASSNDTQDIRLAGNETTNYTVQGLNEDTIYRFAVYASTRIGAGPSDEVTARTDEYCKLQYSKVLGYQVCYIATTLCQECCI